MGTTAMALDVTEEEQAPYGSLRAESDLTKNRHQEELRVMVQGVTETGALESAPVHSSGLESNLHSHATGKQDMHPRDRSDGWVEKTTDAEETKKAGQESSTERRRRCKG